MQRGTLIVDPSQRAGVLLDDPRNIHLDNTNHQRTRERLEPTLVNYSASQELTAGVVSCVEDVAQGNQGRPPLLVVCWSLGSHLQERTKEMLRATVRKLRRLYLSLAAYEHHRLACRASDRLRMHSAAELKDIGITHGGIRSAVHHKCPWCHDDVWQEWLK